MHLQTFEKSYYKLSFDKINRQFDIDFKYWSVNVKKHLNNSISRNLKCVKVYMRWALEQNFHASLEFEKLKATNDEGTIIALTYEEFMSISNLDLADNLKLDRVRDIFIFQCLVGQRYSDILNLKVKDIRHTLDGYFWELYQIKGSKRTSIMIPLLDRAVAIVEKYRKGEMQPNDSVLPVISITNMNVYLKELGKASMINSMTSKVNYSGLNRVEKSAKKWEMLSSHMARRSFVTLSLQMGMRPEVVRAITGHTTGKMLERYTSISQQVKTSEMKEAWSKGLQ
jgi:integrase